LWKTKSAGPPDAKAGLLFGCAALYAMASVAMKTDPKAAVADIAASARKTVRRPVLPPLPTATLRPKEAK